MEKIRITQELHDFIEDNSNDLADSIWVAMQEMSYDLPDEDRNTTCILDSVFCRMLTMLLVNRTLNMSDKEMFTYLESFIGVTLENFRVYRGATKELEEEDDES